MDFRKEPARLVGLIMIVLASVLQLLNVTMTPEDLDAIQVLITVAVEVLVVGGGISFLRGLVASKKTIADEYGRTEEQRLFRK